MEKQKLSNHLYMLVKADKWVNYSNTIIISGKNI